MKTVIVNLYEERYDIYIGRPSIWGNPFSIGPDGTRDEVIRKYDKYILNQPKLLINLYKLKGKRLGCFCKPKVCHGDILLRLIGMYLDS